MRASLQPALLLLCCSFFSSSHAQCVLADYPLDGTGDDIGPNAMNGTVFNAVATTDRWGTPNAAMHFNGVNARIDLPSDFDVPQRTWSFWCKPDVIGAGYSQVYDNDHPNIENAQTEVFFHDYGGVKKIAFDMGSTNTVYLQEVQEGHWYHIAQVRSATDVRYYIDGCLVFTSTDLSNVHSAQGQPTVTLGTGRYHNDNYFNGDLDNVLVFDCALSAEQIDSLADHRCSATCAPFAYYPLDGDAVDLGPAGLDGTAYNVTPADGHAGAPNGAMHFNGVDARIDLPSDFDMPERTWALWCKADVIDAGYSQVYDDDHAGIENAQTELFFHDYDGVKKMAFDMGSTNTVYLQEVQEGRWYHVAQVRSDTEVRYYIDGCLVFTSTDLSNVHSAQGEPTVTLGTGRYHDNYYFNGDLDDVRIYACALTTPEIELLAKHSCADAISETVQRNDLVLEALGGGRYRLDPFPGQRFALEVYDALGRPVLARQEKGTATLDLSGNAGATYIVRATNGARSLACRVVLVR